MKTSPLASSITAAFLAILICAPLHAALPTSEPDVIAYLTGKGMVITKDAQGHAVKLMSSGKPPLSPEEYALIGRLTHLEEMGLNAAPLNDDQWGFLKSLGKLRRLSIWHGHAFASLQPFSGLPVESLTVGGCMGLRDLNRADKQKLLNPLLSLSALPNLKKANLYHSPLTVTDEHIAHLAREFPKLEDLRLDFAPPAGMKCAVTPAGLAALQKLPLTVLSIENASTFTADHFRALAGIKSLKTLLVDARRKPVSADGLAAFKSARPDVEVAVANEGDKNPPQIARKGKR